MTRREDKDSQPTYWEGYSNLQHVKHALIREYLGGWFPKLGFWSGRILYFDTHAGRGRHVTGDLGSPLVALKTFLHHRSRDKILSRSEVRFFLIERDADNLLLLQQEVEGLGELPARVRVGMTQGDCFPLLESVIEDLKERGQGMAPAFVFVDPYGFKIPGRVLRELMQLGRVELFINVIWRELDMAIAQAREKPEGGMASTLDEVFDGRGWMSAIDSADFDERADQATNLLQQMVAARWFTAIRMLGDNDVTRYLLLHLTNHEAGRDLMKDCIWKICPDGGFYARKKLDRNQTLLITPEPNLGPLRDWLLERLATSSRRWKSLLEELRDELWRNPHLNNVIRQMRRDKKIVGEDYEGSFNPRADPLLRLSED